MFNCFKNLEKYASNGMNCLLIGEAGVGKTSYVKDLFDKMYGKDWKYFSSSTLDVFIDFLGIPRDCLDDEDGTHIIDYIKPKWHKLNVKALFLDEFNRSPKKMRNAVLELLQFKTLNGEQFGGLQTIFAAINPEDDPEYSDVEKLDRAQLDRFEVHINVPYVLDLEYFEKKYNKDTAQSAGEWWNGLDDTMRKKVSPRRLQYAIDVFNIGGSLNEVLPKESNSGKLLENLKLGSLSGRIEQLFTATDDKVKEEFKNPNMITYVKKHLGENRFVEKFARFLPDEVLVQEAPNNFDMCQYIKDNSNKFDTSLISTLDTLGCFKESDFRCVFALMKRHFPDNKYKAPKRTHMKKVMAALPDMSTIKVRTSDVPNLQNMVMLFGEYAQISQYQTPAEDDKNYNFISKLSNLWDLSDKLNLGLDFNGHQMWGIKNLISRYRNELANLAAVAQQQAAANPAGVPPHGVGASVADVYSANTASPLGSVYDAVGGNGGAVVNDPNAQQPIMVGSI